MTPLNLSLPRSSVNFLLHIQWVSVHLYCTLSSSSFLKYFFGFWDACFLSSNLCDFCRLFFCLSLKCWCFAECGSWLHILHFLLYLIFSCNFSFNICLLSGICEFNMNLCWVSKLVCLPHPCTINTLNSHIYSRHHDLPDCVLFLSDWHLHSAIVEARNLSVIFDSSTALTLHLLTLTSTFNHSPRLTDLTLRIPQIFHLLVTIATFQNRALSGFHGDNYSGFLTGFLLSSLVSIWQQAK